MEDLRDVITWVTNHSLKNCLDDVVVYHCLHAKIVERNSNGQNPF